MIPTSAFRETLILILFGIVLVPIAAKRAQDAPGYWQTFSKELSSLASYDESPLWVASAGRAPLRLAPRRNTNNNNDNDDIDNNNETIAYRQQPLPSRDCEVGDEEGELTLHGHRHPRRWQDVSSSSSAAGSSTRHAAEKAAGSGLLTTIRFQQIATAAAEETGVDATTTTTTTTTAAAAWWSSGAAVATIAPRAASPSPDEQECQHQQQQLPSIAAKASEASKGRWTLIWMGSAIAAVAVFMSSC